MPPLNTNNRQFSLQQKALEFCEEHMNNIIEAKLEIRPGTAETIWEPSFRRQIFSQCFDVWRDFDKVKATVSEDGRVQELVILGRFVQSHELTNIPLLTEDEVLGISETTGLLGDTAMVDTLFRDGSGMTIANILQVEHDLPASITLTINPKTRQVAAYRVNTQV